MNIHPTRARALAIALRNTLDVLGAAGALHPRATATLSLVPTGSGTELRNEAGHCLGLVPTLAPAAAEAVAALLGIPTGAPASTSGELEAARREASEARAEVAALQRTVGKLRQTVPTTAHDTEEIPQAPAAPARAHSSVLESFLFAISQRKDVRVRHLADQSITIEFMGSQGIGTGDALKANGFRWDARQYKADRRNLWTRKP